MSRVTVLTGPERRRRWPGTKKARIVEESLQQGAVVTAVAHRHEVHPNLLHHWRRQACNRIRVAREQSTTPAVQTANGLTVSRKSKKIRTTRVHALRARPPGKFRAALCGVQKVCICALTP